MKTTAWTVVLWLGLMTGALAQTEQGRWQVGAQIGNLTYQKYKDEFGHSMSIDLSPSAGYFAAKNLLMGASIPYSLNRTAYNEPFNNQDRHFQSIGIGPFVRYYVGNASFKPFAGVEFTYNRTSSTYKNISNRDYTLTGHSTNWAPSVGAAYFFNRNVLLSAGISYRLYHTKSEYLLTGPNPVITTITTDYRNVSLAIGFALLFGN